MLWYSLRMATTIRRVLMAIVLLSVLLLCIISLASCVTLYLVNVTVGSGIHGQECFMFRETVNVNSNAFGMFEEDRLHELIESKDGVEWIGGFDKDFIHEIPGDDFYHGIKNRHARIARLVSTTEEKITDKQWKLELYIEDDPTKLKSQRPEWHLVHYDSCCGKPFQILKQSAKPSRTILSLFEPPIIVQQHYFTGQVIIVGLPAQVLHKGYVNMYLEASMTVYYPYQRGSDYWYLEEQKEHPSEREGHHEDCTYWILKRSHVYPEFHSFNTRMILLQGQPFIQMPLPSIVMRPPSIVIPPPSTPTLSLLLRKQKKPIEQIEHQNEHQIELAFEVAKEPPVQLLNLYQTAMGAKFLTVKGYSGFINLENEMFYANIKV